MDGAVELVCPAVPERGKRNPVDSPKGVIVKSRLYRSYSNWGDCRTWFSWARPKLSCVVKTSTAEIPRVECECRLELVMIYRIHAALTEAAHSKCSSPLPSGSEMDAGRQKYGSR